jgi:hypothetical protein
MPIRFAVFRLWQDSMLKHGAASKWQRDGLRRLEKLRHDGISDRLDDARILQSRPQPRCHDGREERVPRYPQRSKYVVEPTIFGKAQSFRLGGAAAPHRCPTGPEKLIDVFVDLHTN